MMCLSDINRPSWAVIKIPTLAKQPAPATQKETRNFIYLPLLQLHLRRVQITDQELKQVQGAGDAELVHATDLTDMEAIQVELEATAAGGSLGTMVGAQLRVTQSETRYQVEPGSPNKKPTAKRRKS